MKASHERKIAIICKAIFGLCAALFLLSGLIIHLKLNAIDAKPLHFSSKKEICTEQRCSATWTFTAERRFLMLGQILRTFDIVDPETNQKVLPSTFVSGTNSDSWQRLRVFEVTPEKSYQLIATKPSSAKIDYFMGILPRQSNNDAIITIPSVLSTTSAIAVSISLLLLGVIFAAWLVAGARNSSIRLERNRSQLPEILAAAMLVFGTSLTSGVFDSLLVEGDIRNQVLRTIVSASLIIFASSNYLAKHTRFVKTRLSVFTASSIFVSAFLWPFLKQANYWSIVLLAISVYGMFFFLRKRELSAAILWSLTLVDVAKFNGLVNIPDYPPIYFFTVCPVVALGIFAGRNGGFTTISLAGIVYHRFKRDIILQSIKNVVQGEISSDTSARIYALGSILPSLGDLLHAGRISITVNLPLGRPITQMYDKQSEGIKVFDDGTIPGAVTMRSLLYGDHMLYESFSEYAQRVKIVSNDSLNQARYFCSIPIKVNHSIVGSITLTKFNDQEIIQKLKSGDDLSAEKENVALVVATIEQCLSSLLVKNLSESVVASKALHKSLHQEISLCDKPSDFLSIFAKIIANHFKTEVLIHTQVNVQGIAVAHHGLSPDAWDFFCKNPLNLNPENLSSVGPIVVAFSDRKSSYIKDVNEISQRLHPKSRAIFQLMNTESLAAIPLCSDDRAFVVTLFTRRGDARCDSSAVQIIESTEALFIAALEVMSQRSSVVALGELTSRLIGDADVRAKIIDAAKSRNLPTTIGSPKSSFLLLLDLAGSSDLSHDTELKARAYGNFYDLVNRKSQELLNGTIRKTIGDAVIITWDGSNKDPSAEQDFLSNLQFLIKYADGVAKSIGCKGTRAILHHGSYFLGLVGTDTFGQIDVIGSGIDEVCKMESNMKAITISGLPVKLGISESAAQKLTNPVSAQYAKDNLTEIGETHTTKLSIKYACTLVKRQGENPNVA